MKKILSLCLAVLLCAALCGCQRKISLPAVKEIGSIQVETTDGREITLTQESEKAQLMDLLSTGVSTGRQSVQDHADRAALYRHFPVEGACGAAAFPGRITASPQGAALYLTGERK